MKNETIAMEEPVLVHDDPPHDDDGEPSPRKSYDGEKNDDNDGDVDEDDDDDNDEEEDSNNLTVKRGITRRPEQRKLTTVPRVMFRSMEDVLDVEEPNEDEYKERWYSDGEYFFFKRDFMNMVRKAENASVGGFPTSDESSSHSGVANPPPRSYQERGIRVQQSIRTVLDLQRAATGSNNPVSSLGRADSITRNHVAMKYHDVAYEAEQSALRRAAEYELEVNEYLRGACPEEKGTGTNQQKITKPKRKTLHRLRKLLLWE